MLIQGDEIRLYIQNMDAPETYTSYVYTVMESYETSVQNVEVMDYTPYSQLTLIGCTDIGTVDARRIVHARLQGEPVHADIHGQL